MALCTVTTRHQNLNVRQSPSIGAPIIGKAIKGSSTQVDTSQVFQDGGWTWYYCPDKGGWCCAQDPRYSYAFLDVPAGTETETPAPADAVPVPDKQIAPDTASLADALYNAAQNIGADISSYRSYAVDGSAVMYENRKYSAEEDDLDINKLWKLNKGRGQLTPLANKALEEGAPNYPENFLHTNVDNGHGVIKGSWSQNGEGSSTSNAWAGSGMNQNEMGYPKLHKAPTSSHPYYVYNYYMDYSERNLTSDLQGIRTLLNIGIEGRDQLFRQQTEYYNRFKLPNPNDALHKSYAHVFFVRPDCNILERSGSTWKLTATCSTDQSFVYAHEKSPELLRQLVSDAGYDHDFMMYLSNKARSFDIKEEFVGASTYGQAVTGHKIAYGKTNVESKTAGEISVTFEDDRDLHVYQLHKIWTDYISGVYQGLFSPKTEYMLDKILDYVSNVYYILTAEDGETIIFWSKYYGVFPTTTSSNNYSWTAGDGLHTPTCTISYQYSFKEDYNPLSLNDFNTNSKKESTYKYLPIISKSDRFTVNPTWVGAPFIEVFNNNSLAPYTFKLRFRKGNINGYSIKNGLSSY